MFGYRRTTVISGALLMASKLMWAQPEADDLLFKDNEDIYYQFNVCWMRDAALHECPAEVK